MQSTVQIKVTKLTSLAFNMQTKECFKTLPDDTQCHCYS